MFYYINKLPDNYNIVEYVRPLEYLRRKIRNSFDNLSSVHTLVSALL